MGATPTTRDPTLPFHLHRFGAAHGEDVALRHIDWVAPARGAVHLRGRGVQTLADLLTRQESSQDLRTWGTLTYDGIDWRVRPPTTTTTLLMPGTLGANLRRGVPREVFLETLNPDDWAAWAQAFLTDQGTELELETDIATLSPEERARARVLIALAMPARVLLLPEPCPDALLTRAAHDRLVLTLHPPEVEHLTLDLGEDGVHTDAAPRQVPPAPPKWLTWFLDERLAGMPRPGLSAPAEEVATELVRQGITHVLCLEETHPHKELLTRHGLTTWNFPVVDMQAPDPSEAARWCERVEAAPQARVALHCKAGLGRTGTMAVALMMRRGYGLEDALTLLRGWNRHYVQTQAQLDFLREFAP